VALVAQIAFFSLFVSLPAVARELPDFTRLVERNGPAVVNISTKQKAATAEARIPQGVPHGIPEQGAPEEGNPWDDLMRRFFGEGQEGGIDPDDRSLGSGFIIDSSGYILTNNHVVDGAEEILVRLSDRRELVAQVIGADMRSDLALLKVKADNLPVVKFGRSDNLKVGEWVAAIGSPFGFDHSVSVGVVSALGRSLPSESYVPFIQTDVAINPGNSGGPLFNLDGEVVGINSQIYSRTGGFMGLSFAIPIDVALGVVKQLKEKGAVTRGWLGVLIQNVTRELAESFGMERPSGALVSKVLERSPGAKSGIQEGDVIVEFNGKAIDYSSDLPPLVGRAEVGKDVKVKIIRDGKPRLFTVRIGELPDEEQLAEASDQGRATDGRLGIALADLTPEQRHELGIGKQGVLVGEVEPGPAHDAGVRRGDIILRLNNRAVENAAQFKRLVADIPAGKSIPMLIQRRNGPIFLALRLPAKKTKK
jgi:serine protease Do